MNFTYSVNNLLICIVLSLVSNAMAATNNNFKFPYEISLVDEKINNELLEYFHGKNEEQF